MAKEKKVLFVCDKNERTSFGRLTINLLDAVHEKYDAHVLWLKTPKFFPDDAVAKKSAPVPVADARGFTAHEIWAKSLYTGFFTFPSAFRKILRAIKPDVVFFIRPELGFLVRESIAATWDATTIMFVHDTFAETLYPHSIKFKLLNMFFVRGTLCADGFVYNSNWTRQEAAKYFGKKMADAPGKVIGCPIDSGNSRDEGGTCRIP